MKKMVFTFIVFATCMNVLAQDLASNQILLIQGNYGLVRWGKYDFPLNSTISADLSHGDYWLVKKVTEPVLTYKIANEDYRWQETNNQIITLTGDSSLCRWTATNYPIPSSATITAAKQTIDPTSFPAIVIKNCKFYVLIGTDRYEMTAGSNFIYRLTDLIVNNAPSDWTIVYDDNNGVQSTIANGIFTKVGSNLRTSFSFDFGAKNVSASLTNEIDFTTGIEQGKNGDSNISIFTYPNPANGQVCVNVSEKITEIQLINLNGQSIKKFDVNSVTSCDLNLQSINDGIYILRIKIGTLVRNKMIIVKK